MTPTDHPTTAAPRTTYGAVLGSRHVARLLGGTLIGRLAGGMAPVAIVLLITAAGGSLAFGGLLSALYGLASALAQPFKGRLMDRHGQMLVSAPAAILNSGCLLTLLVIGTGAHPAIATSVVALAGLCTPPLEAGLRALWPAVLPDPGQRRVALALDTGSQGLLYIAGPLLVAALTTTHGPEAAIVVTAALGLLGTAAVLTSPASRTWRPAPAGHGDATRRLLSTGLFLLFVALACVGFALGAMNVWAITMAGEHRMDLLSGSNTTQLLASTAGFCAGWLPLLALPGPYAATAAVAVPGVFLTLIVTCAFLATDSLAPAARTTEAYAWLILSIGLGQSGGTALAGTLAAHPAALAALPAAGATAALTTLVLARHRLAPAAQQPQSRAPRRRAAARAARA